MDSSPMTLADEYAAAGVRAAAAELWSADHHPQPGSPTLCACHREWPCTRGEKFDGYVGYWTARQEYLGRKIDRIRSTPTQPLPLAVRRAEQVAARMADSPPTATSGRINDWLCHQPFLDAAPAVGVPTSACPRRRIIRRTGTPTLVHIPRQREGR